MEKYLSSTEEPRILMKIYEEWICVVSVQLEKAVVLVVNKVYEPLNLITTLRTLNMDKEDLRMSKGFERVEESVITELTKEIVSFDDLETDNDIREWIQTQPLHIKEYGFSEAVSEEECIAILNVIADYYLTER